MSKLSVLIILFFSLCSQAADKVPTESPAGTDKIRHEIHIFLPGIQYRYENDPDQSLKSRRYDNYNLAGVFYQRLVVGLEFNEFKQTTASGNLSAEVRFQEFNVYAGYNVFSKLLHEAYHIYFDINPVGYIGQNRSTVETKLNTVSQQSIGEDNITVGLGLQTSLRIGFLIIQPEVRYMYSRSYEPSYVPVYGVRLGFRIGL